MMDNVPTISTDTKVHSNIMDETRALMDDSLNIQNTSLRKSSLIYNFILYLLTIGIKENYFMN